MKTFTFSINEETEQLLESLKVEFHKSSRADVFRMGIRLLIIVKAAKESGNKLTISNAEGEVLREIVLI